MMNIATALKTFDAVGPDRRKAIALEIARLVRNRLYINNPATQYTLNSLPGSFSGLNLLAIMFAAFQQISPSLDLGANFVEEYRATGAMHGQ